MANINVKVLKEFLIAGAPQAVDATISVDEITAKAWVHQGKVAYVTAPTLAAETTPGIPGILPSQITGVTLGAVDSGGAGYRVLRVPNVTT